MKRLDKAILVMAAAGLLSFGALSCRGPEHGSDHPKGEHPEHPAGEHPEGEHPEGDHPEGDNPKE